MAWRNAGYTPSLYELHCAACGLTSPHGAKRDVLKRFAPNLFGAAREMREALVLILPGLQPDIFGRVSELLARAE
jgi:hypothetical protein